MKKESASFSFLAQPGLFFKATHEIANKPYEALLSEYNENITQAKFQEALLLAEKMSILYGVEGLFHYFELKKRLVSEKQVEGEVVDQDVIQVLSLVRTALHLSPEHKERLVSYHHYFLGLVSDKDHSTILKEAEHLFQYYETSAINLMRP